MIELLAPAKLNLCLRIFGRTNTGMHNLDSVVVFCHFGDMLYINQGKEDKIVAQGPFGSMLEKDVGDKNLVALARDAFRKKNNTYEPVEIVLEKNIPISAGLGGGSTDAAATLLGLNRLSKSPLTEKELFSIAVTLGSDVPVCLTAEPHRIKGTGNIIHKMGTIQCAALLLVNPLVALSTDVVFQKVSPPFKDPLPNEIGKDVLNLCEFGNDLETHAVALVPEISEILFRLRQVPSCLTAQMSGSGATCFGIFKNLEEARKTSCIFETERFWTKPTTLFSKQT